MTTPEPPREQHPALAGSELSPALATTVPQGAAATATPKTFKECRSPEMIEERIGNLQQTRQHFSQADSGLGEWISHMTAQSAHSNATASLRDDLGANSFVGGAGPPAGAQGAQPYYQQYLNASSSNLSGKQPARPAGGNLMSQFGSSGFSHSGNHQVKQIEAKGKELFFAAGKAGKGLLSKGKSKLKGTGDKVFF